MRKTSLLALVVLLSAVASADLKAELQIRYGQWDAAYRVRDVKALERMLASDFRILTATGKTISRKDYVKGLATGKVPKVYRTRVIRVAFKNRRGLAWTEEVSQDTGGKPRSHRYRDTWVRRGERWVLYESKTLSEK